MGEISLGEMGLGEMGLGEMGQNDSTIGLCFYAGTYKVNAATRHRANYPQ